MYWTFWNTFQCSWTLRFRPCTFPIKYNTFHYKYTCRCRYKAANIKVYSASFSEDIDHSGTPCGHTCDLIMNAGKNIILQNLWISHSQNSFSIVSQNNAKIRTQNIWPILSFKFDTVVVLVFFLSLLCYLFQQCEVHIVLGTLFTWTVSTLFCDNRYHQNVAVNCILNWNGCIEKLLWM